MSHRGAGQTGRSGGLRQTFPTEQQFWAWWSEERKLRPDDCDYRLLQGHGLPDNWEWAPRNRICPLARYLRTEGNLPNASVGLSTWGTGRMNEELPLPMWALRAVREFDSALRWGRA
jgi:hypothetical protein